jgi:Ca2+-binding EF-hand superfamily protein
VIELSLLVQLSCDKSGFNIIFLFVLKLNRFVSGMMLIHTMQYADRGESELDLLETFSLFDVDQTGFITIDNLREIGRELTQTGETIDTSDFQIQAMMNEFTMDEKISLDDFRRIVTGKRNIGIPS